MPHVSVIMPTYNSAKYISDAIDSVLNQTFKDFEIIVVDDGSTDNTREILKKYNSKIRYIFQENKGPSAARNTGIKNSSGEYIAFLDADDMWLPEKLEHQIDIFLKDTGIGLVCCGIYDIDEMGNVIKETKANSYAYKESLIFDLLVRNVICGSSTSSVVRKECFNKVGLFDETLKGSEDRDMWFRIAKYYDVIFLKESLVKIRVHKNNSHKNISMMKLNQKRFICKHLNNVNMLYRKKSYSYIYLDAAREYLGATKKISAAINALIAIIIYPFKIYSKDDKYQIFIKSLLPNSLNAIFTNLNSKQKIKKKIKLMHIMQSLEIGGLENGVVNLVNNMDSNIFKFSICCIRREGELKERLNKDVKVICLYEKDGFNYFSPFKMARLFAKEKPDIVHMHGLAGGFFSGTIGARLAGVPVVINGEHGILYLDKKRRIWAQKLLVLVTDQIITVSKDLKNSLIRYLGVKSDKITPIINGVDIIKFKPDYNARAIRRKELNLREDDFIIGTIGRLVPVKDYRTLLYAAKVAVSKLANIKFVFIGEGSLRKELENLTFNLGINKNTLFLGKRNDIPELLNMIDLFVLSSLSEGLSNTILEAMMVGKPVVATNVGGNPEIVQDKVTGILVPPRDSNRLAQAIIELATNKELRKKMGEAGCRYAREQFSLERMIREYEGLYKFYLTKKGIKFYGLD